MASVWPEEETFACSVCLETLKDPATLPCGHTYCLVCIQGHWDRAHTRGQYNCPQCRQAFSPRPFLARSTVLMEAMEKLRTRSFMSISSAPPSMEVLPDAGPVGTPQRQGSVYPQLPTVAQRLCPLHQWPLDLYCRDDNECVCNECCQYGHNGHCVIKPEEERKERQKELVHMQADVQRRIQETEEELKGLPQAARQQKASVQALQRESVDVFSELVRSVELMSAQVGELLTAHEASLGSLTEGNIHRLEQTAVQLRWKSEEMSRLAGMEDHICFLKNFLTIDPPGQTGVREQDGVLVAGEVRSAVTELRDSLQDVCKANLAKIFRAVHGSSMASAVAAIAAAAAGSTETEDRSQATMQNTGTTMSEKRPNPRLNIVYEMTPAWAPPLPPARHQAASTHPLPQHQASSSLPCFAPAPGQASPVTTVDLVNPEPKSRDDMLKFHFNPTFDPNTVYRHLLLSDGGRKATLKAEKLNPADHPERFQFWRQVLCREPLGGSPYYWETEWTGQKITIGLAYKEIERKSADDQSRLGHNALSWTLYWSGTGFSFWHRGQETLLSSAKARRVGVYMDQHAGVLAFYRISNNQAHLIHCHQNLFTGPLYPGFRFQGVGATVTLCQLELEG